CLLLCLADVLQDILLFYNLHLFFAVMYIISFVLPERLINALQSLVYLWYCVNHTMSVQIMHKPCQQCPQYIRLFIIMIQQFYNFVKCFEKLLFITGFQ
ncbi:MAG TPA: hypothetical protein PLN01_13030, partial [Spirochaetota bacterium]|nr:hypothetical protein [Spirochaetota bacterium]